MDHVSEFATYFMGYDMVQAKIVFSKGKLTLAHCCHMGTAMKHPVPARFKPSFVIFGIRTL